MDSQTYRLFEELIGILEHNMFPFLTADKVAAIKEFKTQLQQSTTKVESPITKIKIKKLHSDAILPSYFHGSGIDAGMDLFALQECDVYNESILVPTGITIELPPGFVAQVCSRSGLASKGLVVANSPGIIDPGYRGEIKVMLKFKDNVGYHILKGARIAQLVISRYEAVEWEEGELNETERGVGGFGSTNR